MNWRKYWRIYWKKEKREKAMNIEDVFCSKLRMKIPKILAQIGELNVS